MRCRRISSRSWRLSVRALAAKHRGDDVAVMLHEIVGRMRAAQLVDREDKVVLGELRLARLGHRRAEALGDAAARLFGLPLERFVFDELIGDVGELGPRAVELARQSQRDDAVVEHLETRRGIRRSAERRRRRLRTRAAVAGI